MDMFYDFLGLAAMERIRLAVDGHVEALLRRDGAPDWSCPLFQERLATGESSRRAQDAHGSFVVNG